MDLLAEYFEIIYPVQKTEKACGKFKVLVDYPALYDEVSRLRNYWENGSYTKMDGSGKHITKAEYLADIDQMWKDLTALRENPALLDQLVASTPRKRDGTFHRGRVVLYKTYENTSVYHEDEYGWRYYAIRLKVTSDTEACVYINREIAHY